MSNDIDKSKLTPEQLQLYHQWQHEAQEVGRLAAELKAAKKNAKEAEANFHFAMLTTNPKDEGF